MSHPRVTPRVEWFNIAYCYLMKCTATYHDRPAEHGINLFRTNGGDSATRRNLFDRKLLMHATNTIAVIVYEISNAKTDISLRRASTIPLENRFGQTKTRSGIHQTVSAIVKIMKIDEAVTFLYSQKAVKNRRLEYGKIISPLEYIKGLWFSCVIYAESLLCVVRFPMTLSQLVLDQGENGIHIAVDRLMSDILLPFAKTNFTMMSPQKRGSLFQELHGVSPSSHRVIISEKQLVGKAMEHPTINPFEEHLAGLLGGRRRVPSEYLRVLIRQVYQQTRQDFDGRCRLSPSTKREMLEWI
jgi:hypothetical protein